MRHLFTLVLCLSISVLIAQKETKGIFLTANDFIQKKITYQNNDNNNYRLISSSLFYPSKVLLKSNTQKITFQKDSIYGIVENDHYYRFFQQNKYCILNPTETIILYSKKSLPKGKGSLQETNYYFSISADNSIEKLTINNLKKAYKNNQKKIDLIDLYFKNDIDLLEFDSNNNIYKLNRILRESINN